MSTIKTCICGRQFVAHRKDKQTCSAACKKRRQRQRVRGEARRGEPTPEPSMRRWLFDRMIGVWCWWKYGR